MNETNLYAPPRADADHVVQEELDPDELVSASQAQRIAHVFVDYLAMIALFAVFGVIFAVLGVADLESEGSTLAERIWGWVAPVLFYLFFEGLFQRTPGKWLTRTRVVSLDGGKPTFPQILGRSLTRLVPFDFLTFFGRGPGWHDKWSRTRVVKVGNLLP